MTAFLLILTYISFGTSIYLVYNSDRIGKERKHSGKIGF